MTDSSLQQLLASYFAITYTWQLSSSEKLLVGKQNSSIHFNDLTDLDFFYKHIVFILFENSLFTLMVTQSVKPTVLLARRHPNTMLLTNFENINSISNIFQETQDFLGFKDPQISCIYLKTTNRHFRDQGNVHHPTLKLLKSDLVQTLNNFRTNLCGFFLPGKHLLYFR